MALETWLIYFLATLGLSLTPGPNSLLALTHGAIHGPVSTLRTIAGGAAGFACVIALSMFGIASVLTLAENLLLVMKILGGLYLVWLGIQVWRSPAPGQPGVTVDQVCGWNMARQGFLAALSNPKVILFFAAFLPQFIDPGRDLWLQFLVMMLTFVLVECLAELLIAGFANSVSNWLGRCGKGFNRVCGGLFVAIGAGLPLSS
ncbi:Homoserine/homoserine lactone efflux protein [Nitrincola lacisaponensis]|uniref:Homoserine/homoserine lactone efflux protein n=1 Tax=Nitrincola lacisaponensis TaxID=267850 RepID=A0A063XW82_9GAMM|nr:LysE family translocator [Nitrincola lacisaponensis]KDE38448.1 Homoserine/homoserine lactone efflux protein [Nitrincola lacisaponensis]